jgi:hypothetical protein
VASGFRQVSFHDVAGSLYESLAAVGPREVVYAEIVHSNASFPGTQTALSNRAAPRIASSEAIREPAFQDIVFQVFYEC